MFDNNRRRVQNLTGSEIWLFIISRVLLGFGLGALTVSHFPAIASAATWPPIIIGIVLFVVAARGLARRPEAGPPS
jgi:hypothetical protein